MNCNSLVHYGVLGMKWGVRRSPAQLARARSSSKSANSDARAKRKNDLKNRRLLSDSELQSRISRLEMEKKFKNLSDADLYPGRTAIKNILKSSGAKVAGSVVAGSVAYGIKAAMTKKFDVSEAASYIIPNPNKKK